MSPLLQQHYEKLLLTAAGGAVVAGCAWAWSEQPALRRVRDEPEQTILTGAAPARVGADREKAGPGWAKPPAQAEGEGWVYEIFTPPVIYYNATARSFAVTPPYYSAPATDTVFGLELLAVRLEPYRLQLAGYFGEPGDYLAAFVSAEVPQTLLAREGGRFDQLGLTLKSFAVHKVAVESDAPGPVYDIAARAVLHDEQTGGEVELDSRATRFTDIPLAVFQVPDGQGRPRHLREGDTFSDKDATYRIERIQLDPPEVVVARSTPGLAVPETRILRPSQAAEERVARKVRRPGSFSSQSARAVATHGR